MQGGDEQVVARVIVNFKAELCPFLSRDMYEYAYLSPYICDYMSTKFALPNFSDCKSHSSGCVIERGNFKFQMEMCSWCTPGVWPVSVRVCCIFTPLQGGHVWLVALVMVNFKAVLCPFLSRAIHVSVTLCVYICLYTCMCIYTVEYVYLCIYTRIYTYMPPKKIHILEEVYTHTSSRIHMYEYSCLCSYIHE